MSHDYIYWTFSAAAQSISAFVAFLLTGFAMVHSLMESARERDDTLEEIHSALRAEYHKKLTWLAWWTGAAIVFSLLVAYANRPASPVSLWIQSLVGIVDLLAIAGGILFVVTIVNPRKYQNAAVKALGEVDRSSARSTSASDFFDSFLKLERRVREQLRKRDMYTPSRGGPRMAFSFRQMVDALLSNQLIDRSFQEELLEISKYRNLVFHGHVSEVDAAMVKRTEEAALRIQTIE